MITKQINKQFTKREQLLILAMFSLFLILLGATLNMYVIRTNNNKMPVETPYEQGTYGDYLYLNNIKHANNWFLADIIEIGNMMYSIGDMIIYLGCVCFGIVWFIFLYKINYTKDYKTK